MIGLAESWMGFVNYQIIGYKSFIKGRCKITRYGKNRGRLVVCVKNINDQCVGGIVTEMEEIIWIGINDMIALSMKLYVGFLYCLPVISKWFYVTFIRDLNKEINMLRDNYSNAEFLIMGNFNFRKGEGQVELPPLFDVWEKCNAKSYNFGDKRCSKDKNCKAVRSWQVFVKLTISKF
jgi:hypothetical protein